MANRGTDPSDIDAGSLGTFEIAEARLFDRHDLEPETRYLDLPEPSGRTRVFELASSSGEPPAVFLHGGNAFGAFFVPLLAKLDGVRAIVVDRPGYGRSDPHSYRPDSRPGEVVETIASVLDALELEEVTLVAHSMGGHAALLFAAAHPRRVRRLALVGSVPAFPGTSPPVEFRVLTTPVIGRLVQRIQRADEEGVLGMAEVFGERDSLERYPALLQTIVAHERNHETAAAGRSEMGAFVWTGGWRAPARLDGTTLRSIDAPTLAIWGADDPLGTPEDVRAGVAMLQQSRFETLGSGHVPYWSHPERCAALIREFLER